MHDSLVNTVILVQNLSTATTRLSDFFVSNNLNYTPYAVPYLKDNATRCEFLTLFKEIQRLQPKINQATSMTQADHAMVQQILDDVTLQTFQAMYLQVASDLQNLRDNDPCGAGPQVRDIDFELVLFTSNLFDFDYIFQSIARMTTGHQDIYPEQLIRIILADARFLDEHEILKSYIESLPDIPMQEKTVRSEYEKFKTNYNAELLEKIANKHHIAVSAAQDFVMRAIRYKIIDGIALSDLFAPLDLDWKERLAHELSIMRDLIPLLRTWSRGSTIVGLDEYAPTCTCTPK